jgi:hypothetical protein
VARRAPEPFVDAFRAGSRYVRHAPVVRRIIFRAALFLVPASSLFALLPLIASHRLGLGSGGYGLLLAALGIGAIAGALVLPLIRAHLSTNTMVTVSSGVFAVVLAGVALLRDAAAVVLLLLPAGVAWTVVLSTLNASLQLFLPAWGRGRSLAAYQTVLFGGQALGALLFGVVADVVGLVAAMLIAAVAAGAAAASIRIWPFADTSAMDRSSAVYWREPHVVPGIDPEGRPVAVMATYRVAGENVHGFVEAMASVRESRLRTGALRWGLYRDGEDSGSFVELFVVPTWEEHLRQHNERLTGTDRAYQQRVTALVDGEYDVKHLSRVDVPPLRRSLAVQTVEPRGRAGRKPTGGASAPAQWQTSPLRPRPQSAARERALSAPLPRVRPTRASRRRSRRPRGSSIDASRGASRAERGEAPGRARRGRVRQRAPAARGTGGRAGRTARGR